MIGEQCLSKMKHKTTKTICQPLTNPRKGLIVTLIYAQYSWKHVLPHQCKTNSFKIEISLLRKRFNRAASLTLCTVRSGSPRQYNTVTGGRIQRYTVEVKRAAAGERGNTGAE